MNRKRDGLRFDDAFRLDLLIDGFVVVELKSVETISAPPRLRVNETNLKSPKQSDEAWKKELASGMMPPEEHVYGT
jgi:hypothetical protein